MMEFKLILKVIAQLVVTAVIVLAALRITVINEQQAHVSACQQAGGTLRRVGLDGYHTVWRCFNSVDMPLPY